MARDRGPYGTRPIDAASGVQAMVTPATGHVNRATGSLINVPSRRHYSRRRLNVWHPNGIGLVLQVDVGGH